LHLKRDFEHLDSVAAGVEHGDERLEVGHERYLSPGIESGAGVRDVS
jgi:hypothetical protein